jgi:hypothetical protein
MAAVFFRMPGLGSLAGQAKTGARQNVLHRKGLACGWGRREGRFGKCRSKYRGKGRSERQSVGQDKGQQALDDAVWGITSFHDDGIDAQSVPEKA